MPDFVWLEDVLRATTGTLARALPVEFVWCRFDGLDVRVNDILYIEFLPGRLARLFGRRRYSELVVVTEIRDGAVYLLRGYGGSWVRDFPQGCRVSLIGVVQ